MARSQEQLKNKLMQAIKNSQFRIKFTGSYIKKSLSVDLDSGLVNLEYPFPLKWALYLKNFGINLEFSVLYSSPLTSGRVPLTFIISFYWF